MMAFRRKAEPLLIATESGAVKVEGNPKLLKMIAGEDTPAFPRPNDLQPQEEKRIRIWVGRFADLGDEEKPDLVLTGTDRALFEVYRRIINFEAKGSTKMQMEYKNTRLFSASPAELCSAIAGKSRGR